MAETWAYVAAEAGEPVATRLVENVKAACEPLCIFPRSRPLREQLAPGLRVTFEGSYAIYYVHDEDQVVVVRVLHGARDAVALAARGGFSETDTA